MTLPVLRSFLVALVVSVLGTVTANAQPRIDVSPAVYDFGTVVVGTRASASVTLTNVGTTTLVYSMGYCPGSPPPPWMYLTVMWDLAPGASREHTVSLTPTQVGSIPPYCEQFSTNDPYRPTVRVPLVGTVVPAPAPFFSVTPPVYDFGSVVVGAEATASVTVTNGGNATLSYGVSSCPGSLPPPWTYPTVMYDLAPGDSRQHTARVTPTETGSIPPYCERFSTNDPNNPAVQVPFVGTVVAAPAPVVAVTPPAYDFGAVIVGTEATASVTVSNAGDATLTYSMTACPGTPLALPTIAYDLAPGASQAHPLAFTFTEIGPVPPYCVRVFSNDTARSPLEIPFLGTVVASPAPAISVSPPAYDFGTVLLGSLATASVTVSNSGGATLTYGVSSCPGTPFALPAIVYDLAPGASRDHPFSFTPTEVGPLPPYCLQLDSNDGDHTPLAVPFVGTVVAPEIAVDPPALAFVGVKRGSSGSLSFTVANAGTGDLAVASVALCAGTTPEFSVDGAGFTLPPGASRSVLVTYAPVDQGSDAGCLAISSNDVVRGTVTVGLSGARK